VLSSSYFYVAKQPVGKRMTYYMFFCMPSGSNE